MDDAVPLTSWRSIIDAGVTDSDNIINMDVPELEVHNHLPCGRLGDGPGDQFQSAQWIFPLEPILHNGSIRHDSK